MHLKKDIVAVEILSKRFMVAFAAVDPSTWRGKVM